MSATPARPPKSLRTRRFLESDRGALRAIYVETRSQAFTWLNPTLWSLEDFDRDTEGEVIWVGTCDDMPVAFASVWEPENFIHTLFVHPQAAGQGLGSRLLQACLQHVGRPAALKCAAENIAAQRFYTTRGWKCVNEGVGLYGRYVLMHYNECADR